MKPLDVLLQNWRIDKVRPWIRPGHRVLDVGCADGALFRRLGFLEGGVGVDPDLGGPGRVRSNRLVPGLFPADLPDPGPFDAIVMLAVLEHVPEAHQATLARDCERHLEPGGHLLITVPSPAVDHVLAVLRRLRLIHGMSLEQHYGFEVGRTPAIFGGAGLELARRGRFQLGLNNLFVFRKPGGP